MEKVDPVRPADDEARALARQLLKHATFASLAVIDPQTGGPAVSRVAIGLGPTLAPMSLISSLSAHYAALAANPACGLMLGEPGAKGDPLTHPRLMLQARAVFVQSSDLDRTALREHWLLTHPKSRLYIDFADFSFVRFTIGTATLNAGFGKAFRMTPNDLLT